jgi:hypothetical protein
MHAASICSIRLVLSGSHPGWRRLGGLEPLLWRLTPLPLLAFDFFPGAHQSASKEIEHPLNFRELRHEPLANLATSRATASIALEAFLERRSALQDAIEGAERLSAIGSSGVVTRCTH